MVDDPNRPEDNNSFFEEDDFLSADRSADEFDDRQPAEKVNFKDVWEKNPSVKIFAVVAGIAVLLIGFMVMGSDEELPPEESTSIVSKTGDVSQPPGTAELPPAYEEAIRQASDARAENAVQNEDSSIPTQIARPSERIEAPVQVEENDPLSEWRREAETRRLERQQEGTAGTDPSAAVPVATAPAPLPVDQYQANNANPFNMQQQQQPQNPPLPTGPNPETVNAIAQQLQNQMQTVLEAQIPKESIVVSMNIQPGYDAKKYFPELNQQNGQGGTTGAAGNNAANLPINNTPVKPIISAGTIAYAQILTEANSDVPGPVLAEVASGPLMGGRAIGTFSMAQEHLVIQFTRVVKDGVEYNTQAYAIDPGTTLPGMASDINNHYFSRIFLPAAARFVQGFAEAATRQDTQVVVVGDSVVSNSTQDLDTKQEVLQGVNTGAQRAAEIFEQNSNRPRTIRVYAGTRIGLMFIQAVNDPATAGQQQPGYNQGGYNQGYGYPAGSPASYGGSTMGQAYNMYNAYNNYQQQGQQQNAGQQQFIPTPQFQPAGIR